MRAQRGWAGGCRCPGRVELTMTTIGYYSRASAGAATSGSSGCCVSVVQPYSASQPNTFRARSQFVSAVPSSPRTSVLEA